LLLNALKGSQSTGIRLLLLLLLLLTLLLLEAGKAAINYSSKHLLRTSCCP
jgi:hypothetical protein